MTNDIQWEDPPEDAGRRRNTLRPFIDALTEHPGKWAKLERANGNDTYEASLAHYLKNKYGVETRTARAPNNKYWIWARIPEPS